MIKQYNLEERLIDFGVTVINLSDTMVGSKAGNHLSGQLLRSGTSPALNYGEAQSSESRKDIIHKMKIILKELRETLICLKIIFKAKLFTDEGMINNLIKETNELVSIFVKSVATAEKNS